MKQEHELQADIARLLELIRQTNTLLEQLKKAGKEDNSLAVQQEKHLRKQYAAELDHILHEYQLSVHPLET